MSVTHSSPIIAFEGDRLLARGAFDQVALAVQGAQARGAAAPILVFDAVTSEPVDVDPRALGAHQGVASLPLRGAEDADEPHRGPGRPRLGVVAREVTLLPRHWEWLSTQPGGASATIRRLVEQARGDHTARDRVRQAQDSAYRFMVTALGNHPQFEEATRALFAGDRERFVALSEPWPRDLRDHARHLADPCFP
ncbi:MAG TPA: DUF2239 family protein [Gemmatimonadaceae bacterium]|nr:DUF2239 family protein [Gemmatimonadaceae bacterium]